MKTLQKLCALLLLFSLISCDDKPVQTATQAQPANTNNMSTTTDATSPAQAISILNDKVKSNPNDFDALSTLGDLYFQNSQYLEAIQTYDKAIAINPASADSLNDRGLALYYTGDAESALESFERANSVDPNYVNAWLSKGWVLFSLGRHQEAIEPLNKVKELDASGNLSWEADKFLNQIAAANNQ